MEVSRSWSHFIRNESVLQRAYKAHKAYKKRIQEEIQKLTEEINDISCGKPLELKEGLGQNSIISRNPVTVFHAPYFKDVNLYTHPPNQV